jgi:hypothetical protein
MELLGGGVKWKLILVSLEIVLILTQDRCTICTERARGSEIVLGTPMELWCTVCAECTTGVESLWPHPMDLLVDMGQMEARFGPFGDSVNQHTR